MLLVLFVTLLSREEFVLGKNKRYEAFASSQGNLASCNADCHDLMWQFITVYIEIIYSCIYRVSLLSIYIGENFKYEKWTVYIYIIPVLIN